ncbi:MAG: ABC transporter ATP-binding protein [Spirochaetales bacterium]|nr:ABC transporter ATP-binding protein [Spirochaetales bacterium]
MNNIFFVTRYLKKYTWWVAATVGATFVLVSVQLAGPWLIRRLIQMVSAGAASGIGTLAAMVLCVYIIKAVFQFLRSYLAHVAGWGAVADVRRDVYDHLQGQSLRFYERRQTGELMSRLVNDTDKFEHLISHAVPDTVVNVLTLAGVSAVLFSMSPSLMLLSLIPIPLVIVAVRAFGVYVRPAFRERQEDLAMLNANLQDNISGIREIQAFNQEHNESRNIWSRIEKFRRSNLKALKLMATFSPLIEFTSSLGTVIVIYVGGRFAGGGSLSIADLVAFFLYLEMFYQPIRALTQAWEHTQEAVVGAERVREILSVRPEVRTPQSPRAASGTIDGRVSFENVWFHYEEGTNVLEDISLCMEPKTMTALVGPTGVGKSTIASLIPRFYDATGGCVRVDGVDVRDYDLAFLRRHISIVLQDVFLFNGSLKDNILFGNPNATDEDVLRAARIANAHEFICECPDGYDTLIGERGIKLSGGQKQRISIARAVLKDAPILILDEATSAVDTATEKLIQEALDRLIRGRTTVVIAHRLSTIRKADQIAVLENGRVKEAGDHDSLMKKGGLYYELSTVQSSM